MPTQGSVHSAPAATNSEAAPQPRALPAALRVYLIVLLSCWALSALPFAVHHIWHGARLWSTEPLWYQPPFYDFGCYFERMQFAGTPAFWTAHTPASWDYPAPGVFVYKFFYLFNRPTTNGEHKVFFGFLAYLAFSAAVLLAWGVGLLRGLHRRGVRVFPATLFTACSVGLCWPVYFCLQRGNIELVLDTGIALGLFAAARRRWWAAALLLGVFGSGKLYPLLFLCLFLPARRWKEFLAGVFSAAAVSIGSARWLGKAPAVANAHAPNGVIEGLQDWVRANTLVFDAHRSGYDHSLFGFVKACAGQAGTRLLPWAVALEIVALAAVLVLAVRVWRLPIVNQMLLIGVVAMLLMPTSFDYTLMLLVPVWSLLVLRAAESSDSFKIMRWLCAAFALLFAPEAFAVAGHLLLAGQVKAIVLAAMMAATPIRIDSWSAAARPGQRDRHARDLAAA